MKSGLCSFLFFTVLFILYVLMRLVIMATSTVFWCRFFSIFLWPVMVLMSMMDGKARSKTRFKFAVQRPDAPDSSDAPPAKKPL